MKRKQLIEDIAYIKDVIHSSLCYTNLSGNAAIVSGFIALLGCTISYFSTQRFDFTEDWNLMLIWSCVFLISLAAHIYFIVRKARKNSEPVLSRLARLVLYALCPPLLVGAFLTVFCYLSNTSILLPAVWLLCYGLGVWSAGLFSIPESRWLGAAFIITGIITIFGLNHYGIIILAIAFGGYHIVYGWRLLARYGRE